jgi:hypothetical protein
LRRYLIPVPHQARPLPIAFGKLVGLSLAVVRRVGVGVGLVTHGVPKLD